MKCRSWSGFLVLINRVDRAKSSETWKFIKGSSSCILLENKLFIKQYSSFCQTWPFSLKTTCQIQSSHGRGHPRVGQKKWKSTFHFLQWLMRLYNMSITSPKNFKKIGGDLDHPQWSPIFKGSHQREIHGKWDSGYISALRPSIKKLMTLSFLQLLKFEKAKCPYFFYFWPRSQDIVNFFLWR